MDKLNTKNICCIGAGYVGGPTMAVIAEKCPHLNVFVVDINKNKIDLWNSSDLSKIPVFEPNLDKIISKCRGKICTLLLILNIAGISEIVFISVNTPTKTKGFGAGEASDLKWVKHLQDKSRNIQKIILLLLKKVPCL